MGESGRERERGEEQESDGVAPDRKVGNTLCIHIKVFCGMPEVRVPQDRLARMYLTNIKYSNQENEERKCSS